jgi:hypothetical protein
MFTLRSKIQRNYNVLMLTGADGALATGSVAPKVELLVANQLYKLLIHFP